MTTTTTTIPPTTTTEVSGSVQRLRGNYIDKTVHSPGQNIGPQGEPDGCRSAVGSGRQGGDVITTFPLSRGGRVTSFSSLWDDIHEYVP